MSFFGEMSSNKEFIRIFFLDGSVRAFGVDESTTASQITAQIVERFELKKSKYFGLFERIDGQDRLLNSDEKVVLLKRSWKIKSYEEGDSILKKSETGVTALFIFKQAIFFREEDDEIFEDPVARNLAYIQAVRSVIDGDYYYGPQEFTYLAALQFQGNDAPFFFEKMTG